jgi:hypothetical protein
MMAENVFSAGPNTMSKGNGNRKLHILSEALVFAVSGRLSP